MDELVAQCDGGLVRREEAVRVIVKARSFLKTHQQLEDLFERVAKQVGDDHATKRMLMPLMTEILAPHDNMPELNDDDVAEIWEICDTNGDGRVSRPELLLALATWRDNLVRIYAKDLGKESAEGGAGASDAGAKSGSGMCVLL
jgi:Ca2+-binding EF-hand superfamily protein